MNKLFVTSALLLSTSVFANPIQNAHCLIGNGFAGLPLVEFEPGSYLSPRAAFGFENYKVVLKSIANSSDTDFTIFIKRGYTPEEVYSHSVLSGKSLQVKIVNTYFECTL